MVLILYFGLQLASVPSNFRLSESPVAAQDSDIQEGSIVYEFPWGTEALETFRNHGDKPLLDLQAESAVSCQVFNNKPIKGQTIRLGGGILTGRLSSQLSGIQQ